MSDRLIMLNISLRAWRAVERPVAFVRTTAREAEIDTAPSEWRAILRDLRQLEDAADTATDIRVASQRAARRIHAALERRE